MQAEFDRRRRGIRAWIRRSFYLTPQRVFMVLAGIVATVSLVMLVLLYVAVRSALTPPVSVTQNLIRLEHPERCPGEILDGSIPVAVHRTPAVLMVGESWYSVELHRIVFQDSPPVTQVIPAGPGLSAIQFSARVPNLPPGDYEYWRGTVATRTQVVRVPFRVPEGC